MSNVAYFTTSPAILMRRRQASTATTTSTTSTTTTTTCGVYTISVYAVSNKDCQLGTVCNCLGLTCDCSSPATLTLEYSVDSGANWASTGIDLSNVGFPCSFIGTFDIGTCETNLYFRIATDTCTGVLFEYALDTVCPTGVNNCGDCTLDITSDVMPAGNMDIAFSICTECVGNCCLPCCP